MNDRPLPENAYLIPDDAKLVFKGILFDTYQWQQEMFDGSFQTFEMLRRPDTALVIAIDNGQIVLLDEEQPGGIVQKNRLPGGRIESGENPLEAAKREIVEELGERYEKWALLEVKQPAIKIEWFTYVYVAMNKIAEQPTTHEVGEKIEINRVSFDEFKKSQESQGQKVQMLEGVNSIDELLAKVGLK
ncbi:NUDIX hydrolase [Patescibacteria group bacterium]|nr:MAG: NUDIX hydrolase [Patescibacteria group bacterium]